MIGSRSRSREIALQTLFSWDVGPADGPDSIDQTLEHAEASEDVRDYARLLVEGVLSGLPRIDNAIAAAADNWTVARLAVVDRNILRLAVHEMTADDDEVPAAVAIDEAIELGKRYSTALSGAFINGVLDRIRRDLGLPAGPDTSTQDPPEVPPEEQLEE